MNTVFDFSVKDRKGKMVDLKAYANEVLLIVNTATKCGFTPQYEELEKLLFDYLKKYNIEINIDDYNPVSTISGSGE